MSGATSHYTSVYLDEKHKAILKALASEAGESQSEIVRRLLMEASVGGRDPRDARLLELLEEMAELLHLRVQ